MSKNSNPSKKSPWRFLFAGCALWGGLKLLIPLMSILPGVLPQAGVSLSPSEAASIGIIGGADGPTAILTASKLAMEYLPAIAIAAYSYMALIPMIQPPLMRLMTTTSDDK